MSDWSFFDRGLSLFPLTANSKRPAIPTWEQYQTQRADPAQIAAWRQHHWNTGVATGAVSDCIVLDADSIMARIEAESRGIPRTLTIATPRGTHWYFRHPGWPVSNRAGRTWTVELDGIGVDGWDLRGDGGYVVGPGSYFIPSDIERAKGKVEGAYTVELDAPIVDAPDWLLALVFPKAHKPNAPTKTAEVTSAYGRAALHDEVRRIIEAPDGAINDTVNLAGWAIGQLVAGGEIEQSEGWGALWEALEAKGIANDGKADGTLTRGWQAGLLVPRAADHVEPLTPEQKLGTRSPFTGQDHAIDAPAAPPPPVAEQSFGPAIKPQHVGGMQAVDYFEGCIYIANRDKMFTPMGVLFGKSAFEGIYNGPEFIMDFQNSKKTKSAWEFFRENSQIPLPKAHDCVFRPELPSGKIIRIEGLPYVNTFVPIPIPRTAGDASPFVNHVRRMLPHKTDADLVLHYMASIVQNPGKKFQWWPVIQGVKGNGKSLLLDCVIAAVGERYSHKVRADAVMKTGNQFNDWIENKLFLGFEEIRTSEGRRDFVEIMKDTVTARRIGTEGKGKGQGTSDNRANGIMLTNHADAVPIDDDERRWGIFYCAQQSYEDLVRDGMDGDYFPSLYGWLDAGGYAVVTDFLMSMPLLASLDPARGLHRAPETTSTVAAVAESLGPLEQEVQEAIDGEMVGFRNGIVTSLALRGLFDRLRKSVGPKRWRAIMGAVGYVQHPLMLAQKGRPNNPLYDTTKPVLYYARTSPLLDIREYGELIEATEATMKGAAPVSNVVPFRKGPAA